MVGCFFAVLGLIWKIIKAAAKIAWKVLRLLLFRCGLIFIGLYLLAVFLIETFYSIGLWPGGGMEGWFYAGLALSIICTMIIIIRKAVRSSKK